MKRVLMIVGSLRKGSFNRQLAKKIEAILGDVAEVAYLEYSDLPYMNQDIESPVPESVARVRSAVKEADGIWICTPEYNYNIPGVLKNLLDWLSRPVIPEDRKSGSAVRGKTVTISGVAGKSAAAGVRKSLSSLLEIMSMKLVSGEGTGISLDAAAFQSGVAAVSEEKQEELKKQAEEFMAELFHKTAGAE